MGLDIYFNKEAAVKAGLVLRDPEVRGTAQEIADEIETGFKDSEGGYLKWLQEEVVHAEVPGTDSLVEVQEYNGQLSMRANQWGRVYGPVTDLLRKAGVEWDEC